MSENSVILIIHDQIEWLRKHPQRFVNNLLCRINGGETDKYPGYARWNGDGIPGVQVVCVEESNNVAVVAFGKDCGFTLGTVRCVNDGTEFAKVEMLKQLAQKSGYYLRKKTGGNGSNKKSRNDKTSAATKTNNNLQKVNKNYKRKKPANKKRFW